MHLESGMLSANKNGLSLKQNANLRINEYNISTSCAESSFRVTARVCHSSLGLMTRDAVDSTRFHD